MDKPKPKKRPLFRNNNMGVMLLMSFLLIITIMFR